MAKDSGRTGAIETESCMTKRCHSTGGVHWCNKKNASLVPRCYQFTPLLIQKTLPVQHFWATGRHHQCDPRAPPNAAADGYFHSRSGAAGAAGWSWLWSHADADKRHGCSHTCSSTPGVCTRPRSRSRTARIVAADRGRAIAVLVIMLLPKQPLLLACSAASLVPCAPISCGHREQA